MRSHWCTPHCMVLQTRPRPTVLFLLHRRSLLSLWQFSFLWGRQLCCVRIHNKQISSVGVFKEGLQQRKFTHPPLPVIMVHFLSIRFTPCHYGYLYSHSCRVLICLSRSAARAVRGTQNSGFQVVVMSSVLRQVIQTSHLSQTSHLDKSSVLRQVIYKSSVHRQVIHKDKSQTSHL